MGGPEALFALQIFSTVGQVLSGIGAATIERLRGLVIVP